MSINFDKLVQLSRIHIDPKERGKLEKDVEGILHWLKHLKSIKGLSIGENTDQEDASVESEDLKGSTPFRLDENRQEATVEEILQNAPEGKDQQFVVPLMVES